MDSKAPEVKATTPQSKQPASAKATTPQSKAPEAKAKTPQSKEPASAKGSLSGALISRGQRSSSGVDVTAPQSKETPDAKPTPSLQQMSDAKQPASTKGASLCASRMQRRVQV